MPIHLSAVTYNIQSSTNVEDHRKKTNLTQSVRLSKLTLDQLFELFILIQDFCVNLNEKW